MTRRFTVQLDNVPDAAGPQPSDNAWCSYCGDPLGTNPAWCERQPSWMVTRPHSQYCTGVAAHRDRLAGRSYDDLVHIDGCISPTGCRCASYRSLNP